MQVYGIALIVLFAVGIFLFYGWSEEHFADMDSSMSRQQNPGTLPPFTDAVKRQLAASHGFQYLVSYTDRGFEPAALVVKKGETVRFINNSDELLWVAATGTSGAVYPKGDSAPCGQSAFDSCAAIKRGEFWEFTFNDSGTWSYQNNTDTKMTGTVIVQ